jgi:NADPH:quinone reductase-like Zn-dependent oxidoreductase
VPSGGNAKYITLKYEQLIRVPDGVDPVVALCLSSTYVPAREALDLARKMNTPFTGANILVIGGNGPSGLATIELAGLEGANVFTTADERHHEFLSERGAKCFPIDPKTWLPTLKGKMDVVVDSVCLDGFESSSLALNNEGMLVCTGMSALYTQGNIPAFGLRDIRDMKAFYVRMRAKYTMNSIFYDKVEQYNNAPNQYAVSSYSCRKSLCLFFVSQYPTLPRTKQQHFRYLCHLASKDTIKPIVSARASLNMVAFMHRAIEHGDTPHGVCVCTPWITRSDL